MLENTKERFPDLQIDVRLVQCIEEKTGIENYLKIRMDELLANKDVKKVA